VPPSVSGESAEPAPSSELGRFGAAPVDGKLDYLADRATRPESVTSPDDQDEERPAKDTERPLGWCFRTTLSSDFASDSSTVWNGSRSVLVRKHEGVEPDYHINILWQGVDATPYRASRIEVSAHVQSIGGVALFLQAATRHELSLADDRLRIASSNNRFFGVPTQGWSRLSIVGDVPLDADVMYYGVANNGRASLWVDDVRITRVGPDSAVTVTPSQNAPILLPPVEPSSILATPINLDFEATNATSRSDAPAVPSC
jgi:hypothetical protein